MEILYSCCCGMDIHKDSISACLIKNGRKTIRRFGTMTGDLLEMCAWLKENGCEMSAMESTGVLWKPLFNIMEIEDCRAILVNAGNVKNLPGRKTDVKDSEWLADLLLHGLLEASYVPPREQRELRELVRYRKSIIEERSREFNRADKILQGANIKLSSVASSMGTESSQAILRAIASGQEDPEFLASLAKGRMKAKSESLVKALRGLLKGHQRTILCAMASRIEFLTQSIESLDREIEERLEDKQELVDALDGIPGVGKASAQVILAQIGDDMSQFPDASRLASWAGMCPGNNESAGKKNG